MDLVSLLLSFCGRRSLTEPNSINAHLLCGLRQLVLVLLRHFYALAVLQSPSRVVCDRFNYACAPGAIEALKRMQYLAPDVLERKWKVKISLSLLKHTDYITDTTIISDQRPSVCQAVDIP